MTINQLNPLPFSNRLHFKVVISPGSEVACLTKRADIRCVGERWSRFVKLLSHQNHFGGEHRQWHGGSEADVHSPVRAALRVRACCSTNAGGGVHARARKVERRCGSFGGRRRVAPSPWRGFEPAPERSVASTARWVPPCLTHALSVCVCRWVCSRSYSSVCFFFMSCCWFSKVNADRSCLQNSPVWEHFFLINNF